MLSLQDMMDYSDLSRGEIEAIAEHEHVPLAVATEMSEALLCSPEGVCKLHCMILENLEKALRCGELEHVQTLSETYRHLQRMHPLPSHLNS